MELSQTEPGPAWAPQACTLTAVQRQRRAAEFGALFTEAVRGIERTGPTRLRLRLAASPHAAGRAAELAVAETGCCSFFTFILTAASGCLVLDISVPAAQVAVLDALAGHAAAASGSAAASGGPA